MVYNFGIDPHEYQGLVPVFGRGRALEFIPTPGIEHW